MAKIPFSYEVIGTGGVAVEEYHGRNRKAVIPAEIDGMPVTDIVAGAFRGREDLRSVYIPESVRWIGYNSWLSDGLLGFDRGLCSVFEGCAALRSIDVHPDNPCFASVDGMLLNREGTILLRVPQALRGVCKVPEGVQEVAEGAFEGCGHLTEIVFPQGLRFISEDVFGGCFGLMIVWFPDSVERIPSDAFCDCEGLTLAGRSGSAVEKCARGGEIAFHALG